MLIGLFTVQRVWGFEPETTNEEARAGPGFQSQLHTKVW